MNNPFKAVIDVADALVTELNAGVSASAFSQTFTAARTYDADLEIEKASASAVRVDVVPGNPRIEPATVSKCRVLCHIDVAIRQQIIVSNVAGIDALVQLAGEVYAYLAGSGEDGQPLPLSSYPDSAWEWPDAQRQPWPYVPDLLKGSNLFAAILHLQYVVHA